MTVGAPYTAADDKILLTCSFREARRRLRNRSPRSLSVRKSRLTRGIGIKGERHGLAWTEAECAAMRQFYPIMKNADLTKKHLPGRDYDDIMARAKLMKLKKKYLGATSDTVPLSGHADLIDQICCRAKEDGFTLYKLDQTLGLKTKYYFGRNRNRKQKRINLAAVAKAVEFFGGKLVIDWCDRPGATRERA